MPWMARKQEGHSAISQEHVGLETNVAKAHGLGGVRGPPGLRVCHP